MPQQGDPLAETNLRRRPRAPEIHPWFPLALESGEVLTMVASEQAVPQDELPCSRQSGGCRSGTHTGVETLSCASSQRRAAEAAWLPKPVAGQRTARRRAGSGSNPQWEWMVSNERGWRRIDKHERRPEPPDIHEVAFFEDLRVGEPTNGEDDVNEGGAAGSTAHMTPRRGQHRPGSRRGKA